MVKSEKSFFRFLPHTADKKLLIYGKTKKELFEHGALAISSILKEQLPQFGERSKRKMKLNAPSQDLLFADFLGEVVRLSDTYNEVYLKVDIIKLRHTYLETILYARKVDKFDEDIKAVTYNDLFVRQEKGRWVAQVVIDV